MCHAEGAGAQNPLRDPGSPTCAEPCSCTCAQVESGQLGRESVLPLHQRAPTLSAREGDISQDLRS